MQKFQSWVDTHVKTFNKKPIKLIQNCLFYREENNPIIQNPNVFLSPAYGIVMGICKTHINSDESIINAKGVKYSLKDMVANDKETVKYLQKADHVYVLDLYMSFYNTHTNHIPYNGIQQRFKQLKSLKTRNAPMIKAEEAFFEGDLNKAIGCTGTYLVNNQRALTQFYNSDLNKRFYTVQLADDVVNCIVNYNEHQDIQLLLAGKSFGQIRRGSGCSLIIPCFDGFDVEPIVKIGDVLDGGVDAVFKISKLNGASVNEDISFDFNEEINNKTYYDKTEDLFDDISYDELDDELDEENK